jgi:hypothetical protein
MRCDSEPEGEDVDLDEHVRTMSYAVNGGNKAPLTDTLITLPNPETQARPMPNPSTLKQGKFHSWDRYFAEANEMMKSLSPGREAQVITSFLKGLYSAKQRQECQKWLQITGSTWSNLASFGLTNTPAGPARIRNDGKREQQEQRNVIEKRPRSTSLEKANTKANEKRARPTLVNKVTTESDVRKGSQDQDCVASRVPTREALRRSQRLQESSSQVNQGSSRQLQKVLGEQGKSHAANGGLVPARPVSRANTASVRRKEAKHKPSNSQPRNSKGRFVSATRTQPAVSAVPSERRPTQPAKGVDDAPPKASRAKKSQASGAPVRVTEQAPQTTRNPASMQRSRLPRVPVNQITSAPTDSPVPRLVKRKRSTRQGSRGQRKNQCFLDEPELPQLPLTTTRYGEAPRGLSRRLPLPPPPQIPIMPTSD